MPMPLLICGCCTAPVLGCYQSETWAWWEEGAALVPSAVDLTSGPPHLRRNISGSWFLPGGPGKTGACILHPAPRGARGVSGCAAQPHIPIPSEGFWYDHVHFGTHFGESPLEMPTLCVCRALTGFQNPPPARLPGKLPGPPEQPWGMGYSCWSRSLDLAAALLWKEL